MNTKRIIAGITAFIAMFVCMAFNTSEYSEKNINFVYAEDFTDNEIKYEISENESGEEIAVVTGYTGDAKSLIIPSQVKGFRVEQIGYEAFWNCGSLTDVVIPDSVKKIADYAFCSCGNLTNIIIPDSVTEVYLNSFRDTKWLSDQADGVIYAGKVACGYKGEMPENTEITIKEGITIIGREAFEDCTGLSKIILPEGMTAIEQYSFDGCTNLSEIIIPESIIHIGYGAFENTKWLKSHPDGVVYIGKIAYCYLGEQNVDRIDISEGTVSIAEGAFAECKNLSHITLPKSLVSIDNLSFCECISLNEITFPEGMNSIGECVFYGCTGLSEITFQEGLTSIGKYAFYGCTGLNKIILPQGLTSIGNCAFIECTGLSEIILPEGLTSIGIGSFYGCTDLSEIILPEGMTSLGTGVFYGCTGLSKIILPQGLTSIGAGAFLECAHLSEITLPEGVTVIKEKAFAQCTELSKVNLPQGLTTIEEGAFSECSKLSEITLPDSVVSIDPSAFAECSELLSIKGYGGSYAQTYANENKINFITIEKKEPIDTIPETTEGLPGDANNDGAVSAVDIVSIMKYIVKSSETEINKENSDLNLDGVINVMDLQRLKNIFLE